MNNFLLITWIIVLLILIVVVGVGIINSCRIEKNINTKKKKMATLDDSELSHTQCISKLKFPIKIDDLHFVRVADEIMYGNITVYKWHAYWRNTNFWIIGKPWIVGGAYQYSGYIEDTEVYHGIIGEPREKTENEFIQLIRKEVNFWVGFANSANLIG